MGPILPIIGVVGAIASAAGTLASAEAAGANAKYQAQVARNNQIIEQQKEINAINAGRANAQQESLKNAARMAGIRATIAASGIDTESGSAELVRQSQREIGQLSTENVMQNANLQAYGYHVAGLNDAAQAQLYQSEASQAPVAGILGATGSLLGSAKAFNFTAGTGMDYGTGVLT